ncbi:FecCD family ABC transporter permease [Streptomyces sp. NPDC090741]|uniref:FecCD family ABC transporter permease n=1 Tax=Streptomyces sp. NPDC090741 TaxID=3365967 RepID=UPI003830A49F
MSRPRTTTAPRTPRAPRTPVVLALLAAALLASAVAGLALGPVRIAPGQVLDIVLGGPGQRTGAFASIVWDVRMPRVLLGAVVGAGLAVAGTVLQALVRNQLADPFLLGASSGASLGAVLVVVFGAGAAGALGGIGALGVPAAAFAGSMGALVAVYAVARRGGTMTTGRLILAGVAVQYILSALTSLVLVLAAHPDQIRSVLFWTLGGLGGARWDELALPAAALLVGTALLTALARPLDLLLAGEEGARTLGLDTGRFRAAVFVLTSLVIGVLVAYSGAIGFVGLMVPHAARMVVGAGHRALLPVAALGGAVFLTLADLVARTAAAPEEIPVGVVTALAGGPFFLWMLRRSTRVEGVAG